MCPSSPPRLKIGLHRCTALLRLAELVSDHYEPGDLFRDLVPRLRAVVPFELVSLALHVSGAEVMTLRAWEGSRWLEAPLQLPVDETAAGWVWRNQNSLVMDDLGAELRFTQGLRWLRKYDLRAYCIFPLTTVNQRMGGLGFGRKAERSFSSQDVEFLRCAAAIVALSLDPTLGPVTRAEERERLRLLLEIDEVHARQPDPIPAILGPLQKWAPEDYVGVYLYDSGTQSLRLHTLDSHLAETMAPQGITALDDSLAGQAFRGQEVEVLNYSDLAIAPFATVKRGLELGVRSLCLVPVLASEGPLGVLKVASRKDRAFSRRQVTVLKEVAELAASLLENARSRKGSRLDADQVHLLKIGHVLASSSAAARSDWLRSFTVVTDLVAAGRNGPPPLRYGEPKALSESEQLLAGFFGSSTAGLCILDRDLRFLAINNTLAEMNGMAAAAHLGKTVREVLGDFADVVEPTFNRVLATGEPVLNFEVNDLLPTRTEAGHWIEHFFPIKDAAGRVKEIGTVVLEITEKKKLEQSLQSLTEEFAVEKSRLQVLLEIGSALSRSKTNFQETFPSISGSIQKVVRHDLAVVSVLDEDAETARLYALGGEPGEGVLRVGMIIPLRESLLGQLLREHEGRNFSSVELEAHARGRPVLKRVLDQGFRAGCFVPLVTARGMLGALLLARKDDSAFSEQDLDFLKRLAAELALAVESVKAHEALVQEKERLQVLREIDAALVSTLDLRQLLPALSECLRKAVPHNHIAAHLHDESANAFRDHSPPPETKNRIIPEGSLLALDNSVAGQVFTEGKTRVLNHAELAKVPFPFAQLAVQAGVRSICFVPLVTAKGPLGVLLFSRNTDEVFRTEDVELLEQVAAALAQALGNALAHKALRLEKQRLQVLLRTSTSVASSLDVRQTFPMISACVRQFQQHEFASLLLRDEARGVLQRHVLDFPLSKGMLSADTVASLDDSPAGRALQARTPMIFSRDELAAFETRLTSELLAEGIKSLCCIPLITSKEVLGTLNLGSTKENAFKAEDFGLLRQVADQIAAALENERTYREIEQLKNRLTEEKRYLEGEIRTELNFEEIVGESPALKQVLGEVATVATSDATVLVLGETGTGKELIARAIHRMSRRKERGFIKVNCAAIPTGLLESELFGHEKGAFTGAVSQKIGRMELADHGTLFLDEVGEIPLELQPKLLRVLQDHEFERLGGTRTIKVDLRLIAATNRDLVQRISEHEFRSDLYYRLNVFPIRAPSLRERRSDIPLLVRHFVHKYARRMERHIETIPSECMDFLVNSPWPGNVRELENFIERAVILSEGTVLRAPLAELQLQTQSAAGLNHTLENAEREHIIRVLRETGGLISGPEGAAHKLGLKRTTLQSKMQRLKITRDDYIADRKTKASHSRAK